MRFIDFSPDTNNIITKFFYWRFKNFSIASEKDFQRAKMTAARVYSRAQTRFRAVAMCKTFVAVRQKQET